MERYETIVKNKTSIYTFYFPFAIAAIISNVDYKMFLEKVEEIAISLGLLFEVLDDYLDCFGSRAETGKDGIDIQNGKCSWPFVRSKELCSADQLSELYENYGQQDELKIARVLKIYEALNMSKLVHEFTENTIKSTVRLIEQFENVDLNFFVLPAARKGC
ncbi:unnamed protein product [Orchesella dallaii]|uniref:Farnesyl pyrophosphate synthase n=1 Tax=Orchesella dallaii TaxID=48710 RepID=A0ABP1RXE7_9HEXA